MLPRSESELFGAIRSSDRFDAARARRILERAAAEQHRIDTEFDDSFSLGELEEIAAEAGISREAVRAAIARSYRRKPAHRRPRSTGWLDRHNKTVLAGTAGILTVAAMFAFPSFAWAVFWGIVLLWVLILAGVSPV